MTYMRVIRRVRREVFALTTLIQSFYKIPVTSLQTPYKALFFNGFRCRHSRLQSSTDYYTFVDL